MLNDFSLKYQYNSKVKLAHIPDGTEGTGGQVLHRQPLSPHTGLGRADPEPNPEEQPQPGLALTRSNAASALASPAKHCGPGGTSHSLYGSRIPCVWESQAYYWKWDPWACSITIHRLHSIPAPSLRGDNHSFWDSAFSSVKRGQCPVLAWGEN